MKKITTLCLALICCLTMGIPSFAAETTNSVDILTRSELLELKDLPKSESGGIPDGCIALGEEETELFWNSLTSSDVDTDDVDANTESNSTPVAYELIPYAYATQIAAAPLGYNKATGEIFFNPAISKVQTFQTYYQYSSLMLSKSATRQLENRMAEFLYGKMETEGVEYGMVGWYVESAFYFQASNPHSVTLSPGADYYFDLSEEVNFTGTSARGLGRVAFAYPDNKNLDEDAYILDIKGNFSYRYNGKDFTMTFSGGLMANASD